MAWALTCNCVFRKYSEGLKMPWNWSKRTLSDGQGGVEGGGASCQRSETDSRKCELSSSQTFCTIDLTVNLWICGLPGWQDPSKMTETLEALRCALTEKFMSGTSSNSLEIRTSFLRVNKRINLPADQLDLTCSPLSFFLSMQILIMFILLNEILKKWCPSLCRFGCCAEQCKDFIQIWDQCSIQHVSLRAESLTGMLASRCKPYPKTQYA